MEFKLLYTTFLQRLKNQISVLTLNKHNTVPVLIFVEKFRDKINQNLLSSLQKHESKEFEPVLVTFDASLEKRYRKQGYAVLLLGDVFESSLSTKPDNKLPSDQWPAIFTKFQSQNEVKFEFLKMILMQCFTKQFGSVLYIDTRTYWTNNPFSYLKNMIAQKDNDIYVIHGFQPPNILQKFNLCVSAKIIFIVKDTQKVQKFCENLSLHIIGEQKSSERAINEFIASDREFGLKYSAKEFHLTTPGVDFMKIASDVIDIQAFGVKLGILPFIQFPHWYSTQNQLVIPHQIESAFIHTSSIEFAVPPSIEIDELKRINAWYDYPPVSPDDKKLSRSVKSTLSKAYPNLEQERARLIRTKQESISHSWFAKSVLGRSPQNICLLVSHMNSRAIPLAKALGDSGMFIGGIPAGLNYYSKTDISRFISVSQKNIHLFKKKKWKDCFALDCLINHNITEEFLTKNLDVKVVFLLRRPSETIDFTPRSLVFGRKLITYDHYIKRLFSMLELAKKPIFFKRIFFVDSDLLEAADQVFFTDLGEYLDLPRSLVDDQKFLEALGSIETLDEIPNGHTFEGLMANEDEQLSAVLTEYERLYDRVVEQMMKHCLLPTGYVYKSKVAY